MQLMTDAMTNPFPNDLDRWEIWTMLVQRDTDAFIAQNWEMVADDFIATGFFGIDGRKLSNIDSWRLTFPTLDSYRKEWLRQAADMAGRSFRCDARLAIYEATTLRDIEITSDFALAHKKFDGWLEETDGNRIRLLWQSLYVCRKSAGRWKIAAFSGYLPHDLAAAEPDQKPVKHLPAGAVQHEGAGPYSPLLQVNPGTIVVISGQAALDKKGAVVGETIEEQTRITLQNCFAQLQAAGCGPADVFKANVFMSDLSEWERMNQVYVELMPEPRPVRTTVGVNLLMSFKIEIEMWAVRR